jgi:hypothetical protein
MMRDEDAGLEAEHGRESINKKLLRTPSVNIDRRPMTGEQTTDIKKGSRGAPLH